MSAVLFQQLQLNHDYLAAGVLAAMRCVRVQLVQGLTWDPLSIMHALRRDQHS